MTQEITVVHGTPAWFEMVGTVMQDAATHAKLSPHFNLSLVERYTDGAELMPGLIAGLRFEIIDGNPSFRIGAHKEERGDITIEVTTAASYKLNTLYSNDPSFHTALVDLKTNGQMKVDGDLSQFGRWFDEVHDRIVARTDPASTEPMTSNNRATSLFDRPEFIHSAQSDECKCPPASTDQNAFQHWKPA